MAYKSGADGIAKKGKTEGRNLGDTGSSVGIKKVLYTQVLKVVKLMLI